MSTATWLPDTGIRIVGRTRRGGGEEISTINPATEEPITTVAAADSSDVDMAVTAASREFDGGAWSRTPAIERGAILHRAADLVQENLHTMATLETLEVGKPFSDTANGDLPQVVETLRCFAGWADKLFGQTSTLADPTGRERLSYTRREPLGVVGAVTPWNNPAMIAAWKIAPALSAGNTVVLKPPEDASLSTLYLADLLERAGLPPGVLNVVPGHGEVAGRALVEHPGVDKLSFTGSPAVGEQLGLSAGARFRRVTLELGGKAPQLIFPDTDIDTIMPTVASGVFLHAGQVCAAGTRIVAHRDIADEVAERLTRHASTMRLGDPFDPDTQMGPLINRRAHAKVLDYIERGRAEGARLTAGGHPPQRPGYFVEPTVFTGTNDLSIARDEIFGPVATIIPVDDEHQAVAVANDTHYGLSAMLWTNDLGRAHRVAGALRVGTVWINGWGVPDQRMPWGGRAGSGIGRELGLAGIEANTDEKTVYVLL